MNQILISIALLLDALLAGAKPYSIEPSKEILYAAADQLTPAYTDMGFAPLEPSITFENLKSYRGAASVPYWQVNTYCGTDIAIGMQYRYPSYEYYGSIDMLVTLAHEMGHMYQGVMCGSKTVEADATLMNLAAMDSLDDPVWDQAVLWQMRELAITRALAEDCDRSWMADLSDDAKRLYGDMTCGSARARSAYTDALVVILKDDDGIVDRPATPELDVSGLQAILEEVER